MARPTRRRRGWLPGYDRGDLSSDAVAGLTIAVMLVPQGMAYAMLAGLPPVIGLYASVIPLAVYAFLGSSRHLAVGPVAIVSLLTLAACSRLAPPGSPEYVRLVLLLALMVGVIQLAAGLLRFGFLINFFSHAVIGGFTAAAALVIALSQVRHLMGVDMGGGHSVFELVKEIVRGAGDIHAPTLILGLASIAGMVVLRKIYPRLPSAILFVIAGSLLTWAWGGLDIRTVGEVPRGLPPLSLPSFNPLAIQELFLDALAIVFVSFMESISVAKYMAAKSGYKVDPNRELIGLGAANMAGAFFSGYPVTGGFSRTAVNHQAGARTQMASLVTAGLILLTLLLLTPLFYHLPNAVLGAIIIVAVVGLIDARYALHLFRIKKSDGAILLITFVCTLGVGLDRGLLIGMVFSLGLFIWRSSHPHTAELGYLESEGVFRNVLRYPEVKRNPEVLILRPDASLFFANMKFLEDRLAGDLSGRPGVKLILLDLSGVNDIDAVSVDELEELMEAYAHQGIRFAFAGMKGPVRDLVEHAGWGKKYGETYQHLSIPHALAAFGYSSGGGVPGATPEP
jgi:SulP family sulfate permease